MKNYIIKLLKLAILSFVFSVILFMVSPIIDELFTKFDKKKSKIRLFIEIMFQLLVTLIVWDILNICIYNILHKIIVFKDHKYMNQATEIITGIILLGSQKHLLNKIDYLSESHFIREKNDSIG